MRGKILLYLLLFMFGVNVEAQNKVVKRQHTSKTNVTKQNAAVKRKSVQKTGVYVTEDELGPGYYQIHNVPLLSTEYHCWGLTSMIVAKDCTPEKKEKILGEVSVPLSSLRLANDLVPYGYSQQTALPLIQALQIMSETPTQNW